MEVSESRTRVPRKIIKCVVVTSSVYHPGFVLLRRVRGAVSRVVEHLFVSRFSGSSELEERVRDDDGDHDSTR